MNTTARRLLSVAPALALALALLLMTALAGAPPALAQGDTWADRAPDSKNANGAGGAIGGRLYVTGGTTPPPPGVSCFVSFLNQVYDASSDTWSPGPPLPTPRGSHAAAVMDGKLYVIGGFSDCAATPVARLHVFDPGTGEWTELAGMTVARGHLAAAAVGGRLYAMGGYNGSYLKIVEAYDPITNSWTTVAELPSARASIGAAALGGKIYVVGGSAGGSSAVVHVYDPAANAWSEAAPLPAARHSSKAAAIDGTLYVVAGFNATISACTSTLFAYDPGTNEWAPRAPMLHPRCGAAVGAIDDLLYVADIDGGAGATQVYTPRVNRAPVAAAGPDQTVDEGRVVVLDGSGSRDPDGSRLTYEWTQLAGPAVTLDVTDPVHPRFPAPEVGVDGLTLTFQLIVSDGATASEADTVNVTVKSVNKAPVAGDGHTVREGAIVTLDGSRSFDPDGDAITFSWVQTGGPSVALTGADTSRPSFAAPPVGREAVTLAFALTVSDGQARAGDAVEVVVENVNQPPVADAGPDQTVNEGSRVVLDATASGDPDGDRLVFMWTQVAGPPAALSEPDGATPTFTAPPVGAGGATLVFEVTVDDGLAARGDRVSVTVLNINDPPSCGTAQASPTVLWPPDHKLRRVAITGVNDPNNDAVTIRVDGVTQDEPTNGLGDGDTGPDAMLQGDAVLLRAERSGRGNGRVYRIGFTADDGNGGTCGGAVTLSVPLSMKAGSVAIDDGQGYDSTR